MRTLGVHIKENPFYAPYDDECWIELAKEIMSSYADKYAYQIPTNAFTQEDYSLKDRRTFYPLRKSVLRNVMNGPLRNITNISAVYRAFEEKRLAYKRTLGITWEDNEYTDYFDF